MPEGEANAGHTRGSAWLVLRDRGLLLRFFLHRGYDAGLAGNAVIASAFL